MSSKHSRSIVEPSHIFVRRNKKMPSILLTVPSNETQFSNSFDSLSKLDESKVEFFRDFGLIQVSKSPCPITGNGNFPKNSNTRICIADFLGEKNNKKIIQLKKLLPLKQTIKKRIFLQEAMERSSLTKPASPCQMDENIKLRLFLQKSRREYQKLDLHSRNHSTNPSPSPNRLSTEITSMHSHNF